MKKILFVVASLALATGCGGSAADEIVGKFRSTKNEICKCKDMACVDKVEKDFMAWMMKNADKFKNVKPSKGQEEEVEKLEKEQEACKEKLEAAAAPAPAPSGDTAAPATP